MSNDQTELSNAQLKDLARQIDRPVVLVGMMGVGKSSVGRKLAQLLSIEFIDADEAIEEAAQASISEIFERSGEAEFRDGERRVIARLMGGGPSVIATGGGAFCNDETRALILQDGIAIWIDAEVATLVERVSRKDTRPLLRDGDPAQILARLKTEREPFYSQAPIHVISESKPHMHTINKILLAIKDWC